MAKKSQIRAADRLVNFLAWVALCIAVLVVVMPGLIGAVTGAAYGVAIFGGLVWQIPPSPQSFCQLLLPAAALIGLSAWVIGVIDPD